MRSLIAVQPLDTPTWIGAVVFGIFALFCLSLTVLCIYEAVALLKGWAPITAFIRADIDHHRVVQLMILAFVFMLIGHFWR